MAELKITLPDDVTIRLERFFPAAPETVFKAFTDPALIPQWYGVEVQPMSSAEVDLRVGGSYRLVWKGQMGENGMGGEYLELNPPHMLKCTENWDGGWTGGVVINTTRFVAADGGTMMTMDLVYTSREARDGVHGTPMFKGMEMAFNTMDALLPGWTE